MIFCEPLKDGVKLTERITPDIKYILIIFFHGLGDVIMFTGPLKRLRELYPDITFDIGLQNRLHQEKLIPKGIPLNSDKPSSSSLMSFYDIVVKIHFPMSEYQKDSNYTKAEYCCIKELGIEPYSEHVAINKQQNKLIAMHFQLTALPKEGATDREAKIIWDEIIEEGFVPLEVHFEHFFHDSVNKKFSFIERSVRDCKADTSTLAGIIQNSAGFIGVPSGPFHVALASLSPEKILGLERSYPLTNYTRLPISSIKLSEYKSGSIRSWLKTLN